jgi:hypothetical protein
VSSRFPLLVINASVVALVLLVQIGGYLGLPGTQTPTLLIMVGLLPIPLTVLLTGTLDASQFTMGRQALGYRSGLLVDAVLCIGLALVLDPAATGMTVTLSVMVALTGAWFLREWLNAMSWSPLFRMIWQLVVLLMTGTFAILAFKALATGLTVSLGVSPGVAAMLVAGILLITFICGGWHAALLLAFVTAMLGIMTAIANTTGLLLDGLTPRFQPSSGVDVVLDGLSLAGFLSTFPAISERRPWQGKLRFGFTLVVTGAAAATVLIWSRAEQIAFSDWPNLSIWMSLWITLALFGPAMLLFARFVFLVAEWRRSTVRIVASRRLAWLRLVAIVSALGLLFMPSISIDLLRPALWFGGIALALGILAMGLLERRLLTRSA